MFKIKKVTTTDIAKAAGVSQSAVSMILNEKEGVSFSAETVTSVLKAADSLGYIYKKRNARNRGKTIAVLAPTMGNPYYASLTRSIEVSAYESGYELFICNTYHDRKVEAKYLDTIKKLDFSGIIFTYVPADDENAISLSKNIPMVLMGDQPYEEIDSVSMNSASAGRLVGEHLISLGHKKIAFITTMLGNRNIIRSRRLEGITEAVEKSGTELKVFESDSDVTIDRSRINSEYDVGFNTAMEICADKSITAYVGVNDMVAYGILDALSKRGISVPEDASVCGFDDIFPSYFRGINLTTVDYFLNEKGRNAFELLARKISGDENVSEYETTLIEYKPKLIERGTTAPVHL